MNNDSWQKELVQWIGLILIVSVIGSCVFFDSKEAREYKLKKLQIELQTKQPEKNNDR